MSLRRRRVDRLVQAGPGRLVVLFALLILVPVAALAAGAEALASRAVIDEVDSRIQTTASVSGRFVEQHLDGIADVVQSYSKRPHLIAAVTSDPTGGTRTADIDLHLSELLGAREGIQGAFITDLSGRLEQVVPATPAIVGRDFSYRDWYRGLTTQPGGPYVSEAYRTQIAGEQVVVAIATFIHSPGGQRQAILAVTYRVDTIQAFVREMSLSRGIDLHVTDQRGTLVAAQHSMSGLESLRRDPEVRAALGGRSGVSHRREHGQNVVAAWAPVPTWGWTITASLPSAQALAGVGDLRTAVRTLATILGLIVLGALAFLYWVLRALRQSQEDLAVARDQAMEGSRLKSEFLANMSHEVRTPMTGVIGMLSLLLDSDLDGENREFAKTAQRSGEALLDVINDILDFSKIEAGKLDIETVDFDLRTLVEDSTALFAARAQEKRLELVLDMAPDVPAWVCSDPGRLRQVLTNLLGNAVKFTAQGEVVLRVTVESSTSEAASLTFEVIDTGIGIPEKAQATLFEAFTQADASTTRQYGGTGLGLAISSQIVQLLGGRLALESAPGEGSRFFFTIDIQRGRGAQPAPAQRAELRGLHVLLVDDNATNLAVLKGYLSAWGMTFETASGAAPAMDAFRAAAGQRHFDVAVLDLNMPGTDGITLAKRLRAEPAGDRTRLVLLTSSAQRGEAQRAADAGMDAYLTKPVRQSELFDCLATVMGRAAAPAPEPQTRRVARRGRVLVAEDNEVNQLVATRTLESLGYVVDVVANGEEAVEAVFSRVYDAVLMDCQMPVMDGYQATAEIRRREAPGRHVPIIALTAGAMQGDSEKCLAAGMDDYVAKPVPRDWLDATLSRWLDDGPLHAAVAGKEVLDREVVEQLREIDDSGTGMRNLAELFSRTALERSGELDRAVDEGDGDAIARMAHSLRGSSASFGGQRVAALCAAIEEAVGRDDIPAAAALCRQLPAELAQLGAELARAFGPDANSPESALVD